MATTKVLHAIACINAWKNNSSAEFVELAGFCKHINRENNYETLRFLADSGLQDSVIITAQNLVRCHEVLEGTFY